MPQCTALILPRAEPPRAGLSQVSLGMNLSHLSTEAAARMPEGMALPIYLCQRKSISLSSQASSSGSIKIKKNNNKNPSSPVCCHIHRAGGVQIPPQPCSEMHRPRYPGGEDAPQAASRSFLEKLQVQPVGPRFPQKWPRSFSSTRLSPNRSGRHLHPQEGARAPTFLLSACTGIPACIKALQIRHCCMCHVSRNKKIQTAIPYFYEQMALDG